jgi:hypothetical protein
VRATIAFQLAAGQTRLLDQIKDRPMRGCAQLVNSLSEIPHCDFSRGCVFQCRVEPAAKSAAPDDREQGNRVRLWIRRCHFPDQITPLNRDVPEGDMSGFTAPQRDRSGYSFVAIQSSTGDARNFLSVNDGLSIP